MQLDEDIQHFPKKKTGQNHQFFFGGGGGWHCSKATFFVATFTCLSVHPSSCLLGASWLFQSVLGPVAIILCLQSSPYLNQLLRALSQKEMESNRLLRPAGPSHLRICQPLWYCVNRVTWLFFSPSSTWPGLHCLCLARPNQQSSVLWSGRVKPRQTVSGGIGPICVELDRVRLWLGQHVSGWVKLFQAGSGNLDVGLVWLCPFW